jgi:hypothetical protein
MQKATLPEQARSGSIAHIENPLYRSVLAVKEEHALEELGIAFWDAETTMSVEQLAYQMITRSSNFATNLLVDSGRRGR